MSSGGFGTTHFKIQQMNIESTNDNNSTNTAITYGVCHAQVFSRLFLGDCLELYKNIEPKSIDLICTDLPYGTTACKWDTIIPFDKLWEMINYLLKPNGTFITTASQPFTSALIMSNLNMFKYEIIWKKSKGCNFTHAKNMPIKFHENIVIFSNAPIGHKVQLGERRMTYNPQGLIKVDKKWSRPQKYDTGHKIKRESHKLERIIEFENYPTSIFIQGNSDNNERGLHETQKPVALFEYLLKTYSNENMTIFDPCMGSGTTGVACKNTNRNFIGIEKEPKYYDIACQRCGF
jgi:site-specific DNA-methyltransferase (adenine-specific)